MILNHAGWFLHRKRMRLIKIPHWRAERLKRQIKTRLATEDYTCRMVDPGPYRIKPRVRYKLSLKRHYRAGSFRGYLVYK